MGRAIAEAGLAPDLALVSTATRALETWRAVAPSFPKAQVREDAGLYAAPASRLAAAVRDAPAALSVILVGHNPGLHQYAVHLARQADASGAEARTLYEKLPTGAAAVFALDEAGRPTLERLFLPKALRGR